MPWRNEAWFCETRLEKNGNKVRLSKLGEARDERLIKTPEAVDAESKKFALEWVVVDLGRKARMCWNEEQRRGWRRASPVLSHQWTNHVIQELR